MSAFLTLVRVIPSWCYWLVALIALCGFCELHGRHAERKKWEAKEIVNQVAQVEATLTKEREVRKAFDTITVASQEKEKNAQVKIDRLQSDVRAGAVRLSVRTSSCKPTEASAGHTEGRSELLQTDAIAFVGIAGDADRIVRKLNECIDKYNALP